MADCIVEQITANLMTALGGVSTYGGDCSVERERIMFNQGDRDPLIVLYGPDVDIESHSHTASILRLDYSAVYYKRANDDSASSNTEVTYLARNVAADIVKVLKTDRSRSNLAQDTQELGYGITFAADDESGDITFMVGVDFSVRARVSATDPYLQA